jgi:hypothetical protein
MQNAGGAAMLSQPSHHFALELRRPPDSLSNFLKQA